MFTDAAIQTVSLQYELEQPGRICKVMNAINALHLWQTFFPWLEPELVKHTWTTMAAWSDFLLSNKPPVYVVFFWASRATVTNPFLLPVRLCIISTDSTLLK